MKDLGNFFDPGEGTYRDVEVEGFGTVRVQEPSPDDQDRARDLAGKGASENRIAMALVIEVCEDPETGKKIFDRTHLASFMQARGAVKQRLMPILTAIGQLAEGN